VDPIVEAYALYHEDLVKDEDYKKAKQGVLAMVDCPTWQCDYYNEAVEYFV
jgi:hypothetical protein